MERTSPVAMEEVNDPVEVSNARIRREMLDSNFAWLRSHASEVYATHRGKCICVSGEKAFAGDTAEEAIALAAAAHPDDQGSFVQYIPREKIARVYDNQR